MAVASPTKSRGGSGKKITVTSARVGEKLAHLRANLQFGIYRLSHPTLPEVARAAAQSFNIVRKSVATEKRRQLEAKARAITNEKDLAKRREQAMRAGYSAPL